MTSSESLTKLYQLFLKLKGPKEAREMVSTVFTVTLYDIQEEGLEITPALLDERINKHVNDYLEVAKATKVA